MGDFKFDLSPKNPEVQKVAEVELRETDDNKERALRELRLLLKSEPKICLDDDDFTLTVFLRPCKWYAKSAFDLIKKRYEFTEKHSPLFDNLNLDVVKPLVTEQNCIKILKNKDQNGRRILYLNCGSMWDPATFAPNDFLRVVFFMQHAGILEPENQIRGVVIILDFEGLGLKQVKPVCNPFFAFASVAMIQEIMPLRVKEIHLVRQPYLFKLIWQIFKPLLNDKLRKRVFFHGNNLTNLHKYINPENLPKDFDGNLPKIDYNGKDWWPAMEANRQFFEKWSKYGIVKKI